MGTTTEPGTPGQRSARNSPRERPSGPDDAILVDLLREGQLDEDSRDPLVPVQLVDERTGERVAHDEERGDPLPRDGLPRGVEVVRSRIEEQIPERVERRKYCPRCDAHRTHKESK